MKKIFSILIIIILALPIVFADGAIIIYDEDIWKIGAEDQQLAAINYEEGIENMLISVNLNEEVEAEKAVWIFPVPASHEQVQIDILKGYPVLLGKDLENKFEDAVSGTTWSMRGYSLFPFSIPFFLIRMFGSAGSVEEGYSYLRSTDLRIWDIVNKHGLTSELATAKNQQALDEYLAFKGLELPQEARNMMGEYIGQNSSFVITYINDLEGFMNATDSLEEDDYYGPYYEGYNNPIGVFVKFPTEKIYFPLKPTSVYGNQKIPILMYVMGYVTPNIYQEISKDVEVTYFSGGRWYEHEAPELKEFFNSKERITNLGYTKIKINTSSNNFVDDLWIENSVPLSIKTKEFLVDYMGIIGVAFFIIFSLLSGLIAGVISFRKEPISKTKFTLWGLWNCSTLIGFATATSLLKGQKKSEGERIKLSVGRKFQYFFLFYVFFIIFVFLFSVILKIVF